MNYSTPIIDGYNAVVGPINNLPLDDIQAHPEQYLNYEYTENKTDEDSLIKRIEKLEQENADMNRIFEGWSTVKAEYFKAICQMAVHGAQNLPGETAASVPELYPSYEWLAQNNVTVKKAQIIFRYGDKLYRTVKNNTKFDGKNIPGEDSGKYFREVIPETGRTENTEIGKTNENPISVTSEEISAGYTFKYGYFYEYDGIVYRCIGKNGKGVDGEEYDLTETPDNSKYFEVAW